MLPTHTPVNLSYNSEYFCVIFYIILRDAVMMMRRLVIILREQQIFLVTLYKIFSKFCYKLRSLVISPDRGALRGAAQ